MCVHWERSTEGAGCMYATGHGGQIEGGAHLQLIEEACVDDHIIGSAPIPTCNGPHWLVLMGEEGQAHSSPSCSPLAPNPLREDFKEGSGRGVRSAAVKSSRAVVMGGPGFGLDKGATGKKWWRGNDSLLSSSAWGSPRLMGMRKAEALSDSIRHSSSWGVRSGGGGMCGDRHTFTKTFSVGLAWVLMQKPGARCGRKG